MKFTFFISAMIQALCARIVPSEVQTHALTANEVVQRQHPKLNFMTIYSPCDNDAHFFDSWGG